MLDPSPDSPAPPDVIDSEVSPRSLSQILPSTLCWQYQAIPLNLRGRILTVGMVQPQDAAAVAELKVATSYDLEPVPMDEEAFERMYASLYPESVFAAGTIIDHSSPAMQRFVRMLQEAGSLLWTSSEFIGWAFLVVFILAAVGIFYYFAQALVMLVVHFILKPVFILTLIVLFVAGILLVRVTTRHR